MIMNIKRLFLSASIASLVACGGGGSNLGDVGRSTFDDPVDDAEYSSGDLDLSRYVAVGDSLTAGFKDGTLYLDGQLDSFPNILSELFAEAGGGDFKQPLMADNLGGLLLAGNPIPGFETRLVLTNSDPDDPSQLAPVRQSGTPLTDVTNVVSGPFNNLGVPGAKSFHIPLDNYGNVAGLGVSPATANPFFVRFASAPNSNLLADALAQAPTFFTVWVGNNDILSYATAGGTGADSSSTPAYGTASDDITDPVNVFAPTYTAIVNALSAGGANGVLITLPDSADTPFFTTVPYNAIPLSADSAAAANAGFAAYNGGLSLAVANSLITQAEADQRTINFVAGQNAVLILDEDLTDLTGLNAALLNFRQATADDLILLSTSSLLGTERTGMAGSVIGVSTPLLDSEILTAREISEVDAAREAYNTVIADLANSRSNLALYDVAATLRDLNDGDGIDYGTGNVTGVFATGGAFSLDGVHMTARGYAIIANDIIDVLNENFNADLPRTDPGVYSEVFFEFSDGFDFTP